MRSKYGNTRVFDPASGFTFDSKAEFKRYGQLVLLERAKEILDLSVHKKFDLMVNNQKVCTYESDFTYKRPDGAYVVEDVKGVRTREYIIKRKLMKILFAIDITEIAA